MNMIELVKNKLDETGLKVLWQLRPEDFPSITFTFISENGEVYADDKAPEERIICQVDIWSREDYSNLVDRVIILLRQIDMYKISGYDQYEKDTEIYHKILRFSYLRESEE